MGRKEKGGINTVSDFEYFGNIRVRGVISDLISDTLDSIDGEKSRDVETPDILRYTFGATEVEGEYPACSVMGLRETTVTDEEDWKVLAFTYNIEIFVVGDDSETLEKYCARYARAVKDILWDAYSVRGSFPSVEYPPILSRGDALYKGVSVIFRLLVKENKAD